jgi:hypothetical protein
LLALPQEEGHPLVHLPTPEKQGRALYQPRPAQQRPPAEPLSLIALLTLLVYYGW